MDATKPNLLFNFEMKCFMPGRAVVSTVWTGTNDRVYLVRISCYGRSEDLLKLTGKEIK